ncbi:glycosyltransferase family 4 protein [Flavobacteriales bacterium AH-315-E23]|nr:glycosyltransferase family 4 protein [Flavobacteriales bacterium AH-315-E23]
MKRSILFLVQLPPPVHGAALRNEFLSKSALLNEMFDIDVMRLDFARSISDVGKFSIVKLIKMFSFSIRLLFRLLFGSPDLIYHNFAVKGIALYRDWFFIRLAKLFRVPIVLHLRTQGVREQAAQSSIKRALYKGAFTNTTIVCLSNFMAKDIESVYSERPRIIANGIDLVITDSDINNNKENSVIKFLFLSNLTRSKGIFEFIDAMATLKDIGHQFKGEIVGPEFDVKGEELQQYLKEKGMDAIVEISDSVYGDEKFQKYLHSDVFVFPTWFEAFPAVILEAMQCGIPVVSTKEGAIPEIVDDGNTGFLVQQKDVPGLAEKMELLLRDKSLRNKMGADGRIKFVERYTSATFAQNMNEVFKSAMAN